MTTAPKKAAKKAEAPQVEAPGIDWQAEYPDEEVFVFTASDGSTVGMKAVKLLPGEFRRMRHLPAFEQTYLIVEKASSPAALAVSDTFGDKDYAGMMEAWTEWNSTSLGES